MSSHFPPQVAPRWIKPGQRWQEILVVSKLESWISHWDTRLGKSRRCGGPGCLMCSQGYSKQLRVVLMGIDASARDVLVEVRERHRSALDPFESTVGLVLKIRKNGTARNTPVEIQTGDFRQAAERDIRRLVESLGEEPLFLEDTSAVYDRSERLVSEISNPVGFEDFE